MFNSALGRACKRLLDANDSPWLLPLPPWCDSRDRQVRRIRRAGRAAMRRRLVAERGWGPVLASAALWPALALIKAGLDSPPGPPRARLLALFDTWWLQTAHNLRLDDQHRFRLDAPAQRRKARRIVTNGENKTLLEFLNRDTASRCIGDKLPFAEFCRHHGLPTVPLLSTCAGGAAPPEHLAPWPEADLFLKPAALWGGQGATILHFDSARRTWAAPGAPALTPDSLAAFARDHLHGAPWLLQPRLANSPDWAPFAPANGALATVRVVTGRLLPCGPVQLIGGVMRFPRSHSTVDNLCPGGLGADFDVATGRLHAARTLAPRSPFHTHHPDTGGALQGAIIPRWPEIAALALRAHVYVTDIPTLGWDVALPPCGPLLLETNPNWGVQLDIPLGDTLYIECLLQPAVTAGFPR
ncbi:MAG: hypothetical protein IPL39_03680 [Opitutaceae bacterium]|nr:hypothetical protein [Opitutaceae bacterium]